MRLNFRTAVLKAIGACFDESARQYPNMAAETFTLLMRRVIEAELAHFKQV